VVWLSWPPNTARKPRFAPTGSGRPGAPTDPHCTTLVEGADNGITPTRTTTPTRRSRTKPVRQSVTIPAPLAAEVRRVAKEHILTMSRAVVSLAERGVRAELDAKGNLKATYKRFLREREPVLKNEAGKDLIRAIFGKDAIAEDTVLRSPARSLAAPARPRRGVR